MGGECDWEGMGTREGPHENLGIGQRVDKEGLQAG